MNRRINRYAFHIRFISRDDADTLESVLRTLGKAALRAENQINDVAETQDGEYLAEVVAEERMLIDDLLGCAFVAAQTYITRVISRIRWLHDCVARDGHDLTTTDATKAAIINGFSNIVPGTTYSEIQVIDAFANYFKHREAWPPKWDNATGQSAQTVRIIRSVGVAEDSSDNCRKGLMALGTDRVFEVHRMAETLTRWHAKLADAYKNEVMPLGEP